MCFKTPKVQPVQPDPAVEAAKMQQSTETVARLAEAKEEDTKRQRGLVYGLFGPRALITSGQPGVQTSVFRPAGT